MSKKQGIGKSRSTQVEITETLVQELAHNLFSCIPKSLSKDSQVLRARSEHEGFGFHTNVMPALSGLVECSLETGTFTPDPRLGFKAKKGWKTPAFLQCFFERVYAPDGSVKEDACAFSIYALRQVLSLFKKVERDLGPWCEAPKRAFIQRAEEPRPFNRWTDCRFLAAATLLGEVFADFDPRDIVGKHGPGVVADRLSKGQKWDHSLFTPAQDRFWPRDEFYSPPMPARKTGEARGHVGEIPARLIMVPKTSKTPRLIAAEPSGTQFLQGGLAEKLVRHVGNHWLTAGHVNFHDQTINQRLAREGSLTREWTTIDLSDASDTLGHELVQALFPQCVGLALDVLRTSQIAVDETTTVSPTFYAVMGSALTFPVESLAFYSIAVGAVMGASHSSVSGLDSDGTLPVNPRIPSHEKRYYASARDAVYVFGDDIVVRTEHASAVTDALRVFGFKPNISKSYSSGFFRESCGKDYYRGVEVRPLFVRCYTPVNKGDVSRRVSILETANQFADSGLFETAGLLYRHAGDFPVGRYGAPYLCRRNLTPNSDSTENRRLGYRIRWRRDLQIFQIRARRAEKPLTLDEPSAGGRYLAALMRREIFQTPFLNKVTGALRLKTGWMQCYN